MKKAVLALVVGLGIWAIYPPSLSFDFYAEDFVFFRPFQAADLWKTWTGNWLDMPGAPGFYRPLMVLVHATEFYLFGLNSFPTHVLSIAIVAASGVLAGMYVWRETNAWLAACTASLVYVIHPTTTVAVGPWTVNHYHGLATMAALWALLLWQSRRHRPLRQWAPMLVPLVCAAWLKEDGLMLPLVILVAHWAGSRWTGTVARLPRSVIVAGFAVFLGLNFWRVLMLGGVGGYWWPDARDLALNLVRGPGYLLLLEREPGLWNIVAIVASVVGFVVALMVVARDRASADARVALTGFAFIVVCNLPLALMTSRARGYYLALGASLVLSAAVRACTRWARADFGSPSPSGPGTQPDLERSGLRRVVAAAGIATLVISFVVVSRDRLFVYSPCGMQSHDGDLWVRTEMIANLPPEFAPWLDRRLTHCDPTTYRPLVETLPSATWTLPSGDRTILVPRGREDLTVILRSAAASATQPIVADLIVNGDVTRSVTLSSPESAHVTVPLRGNWLTTLRRSHRVDVRIGRSDVLVSVGGVR